MPRNNRGIHVRFRKERQCWEIGEFIRGKLKRHATGLGSRADAEARLAEIIVERTDPAGPENRLTLGEIAAYYIREHVPTLANPDTALKCFERLLPFWGDLTLADIRKSKCQDYLRHRRAEFTRWQEEGGYKSRRVLSDETCRRELEQLQAAIRYAHAENIITSFPSVWKPQKSGGRDRWLTRREAAALLRAARKMDRAREYLPLFILLALYTGARSDAVLTLRWPQVDLRREIIDFRAGQRSRTKGRAAVPIPRRLLRELKKARTRGTETGYVVHQERIVTERGTKKKIQSPIKSVKNSFGAACAEAGLGDVTPHTLRHTAASWMIQKGVPVWDVAKYLGHSSIAMVEKTYGHMAPEHLKRAKESWG